MTGDRLCFHPPGPYRLKALERRKAVRPLMGRVARHDGYPRGTGRSRSSRVREQPTGQVAFSCEPAFMSRFREESDYALMNPSCQASKRSSAATSFLSPVSRGKIGLGQTKIGLTRLPSKCMLAPTLDSAISCERPPSRGGLSNLIELIPDFARSGIGRCRRLRIRPLGTRLMIPKESVSFRIYIPICQRDAENPNLYLYYSGEASSGNRFLASYAKDHETNGDLHGRLTVFLHSQDGPGPPSYVWKLDESMMDAPWMHEALSKLAATRRGELRGFLARCLRDVSLNPAIPFRAVFTSCAQTHGWD